MRQRSDKPRQPRSFKRNVLPAIVGVVVMVAVMGLINSQLLIAQYKYRFSKPAGATAVSVTTDNTAIQNNTTSVNPELGPRLTIPGIGVEAPIIFETGTAESRIQTALRSGIVHYAGSVQPGQAGNVVVFGHSSGQTWAPGEYKFVFTLLDKMRAGDFIYLDYGSTRYTYQVVGSKVVTPTDVGVLNSGSGHELTLITCTPVGTSTNRFIISAKQISPAPAADDTVQSVPSERPTPAKLPGSAN